MIGTIHKQFFKVDLNRPLVRRDVGCIATRDKNANRFGAELYRDCVAVDASGLTVTGYFIRPDASQTSNADGFPVNNTVVLEGAAEGNLVFVDLNDNCYAYDGAFTLAVQVSGDGFENTVLVCDGNVLLTMTDQVVTGGVILSIPEIAAKIEEVEAALENAEERVAGAVGEAETATNNAIDAAAAANEAAQSAADATQEANDAVDALPDTITNMFASLGLALVDGKLCVAVETDEETEVIE